MRRVLVLLVACGNDHAIPDAAVPVASFPAVIDRDVDWLVMSDNSNGGPPWQRAMSDAFPTVTADLAKVSGGLPDLHIGLVTSDLGTSPSLDGTPAADIGTGIGSCSGSGDGAAMQVYTAPVTDRYIVDVANADGTRTHNYQGTLEATFGEILAASGANGCSFEQDLAAVTHALTNPTNAGFRRPGANLVILLMGDEDDCSVKDARFFDPANPDLGPLASFRCTSEGLTCDQPLTSAGDKTSCKPREDSTYVAGIQDAVDAVRAAAPSKLLVESIIGNPEPIAVESRPPPGGGSGQLALSHSCSYVDSNGSTIDADPGLRVAAWTTALGGNVYSVCNNDFTTYAHAIAHDIRALIEGQHCISAAIDPSTCTAFDVDASGTRTELPRCPASGDCFDIEADAECATDVVVTRVGAADPSSTVQVFCK